MGPFRVATLCKKKKKNKYKKKNTQYLTKAL